MWQALPQAKGRQGLARLARSARRQARPLTSLFLRPSSKDRNGEQQEQEQLGVGSARQSGARRYEGCVTA